MEKKRKRNKKFFQKFHKYKTKPLLEEENISHWSFCEGSNNYVDIHLLWSKKIIKTLKNVKVEKVKTALLGLKRFYSQISSVRPDFSNPYILECYNQTAKNYQLPEKKLKFKNDIEVKILDPFADVRGENVVLSLNDFYKDKKST